MPKSIRWILGLLVGEASVCWNPKPKGVFDSAGAAKAVDRTEKEIKALMDKPNLGLATNKELLEELKTRIEIHWDLNYRTIDS